MNTTALLYFGTGFEWILELWMKSWCASRRDSCLVIVTTPETVLPACVAHCETFVVTLSRFADVLRPGVTMDVKEALALAAMLHLPGRLLVLDADALIQHDPWSVLNTIPDPRAFGMVSDCGERMLELGREGRCPEHNAGVLFFGEKFTRLRIALQYARAFHDHLHVPNKQPAILGQRAWSIAHHRLSGEMLPDTVNWSHCWGKRPDACVFHYHGNNGKKKLRAIICTK